MENQFSHGFKNDPMVHVHRVNVQPSVEQLSEHDAIEGGWEGLGGGWGME